MNDEGIKRFDQKYTTTDIKEIKELFSETVEDQDELQQAEFEWEVGRVVKAIILINSKTRETKKYIGPFDFNEDEIKEKNLLDYYYTNAIVHLVKWDHITIQNELEGLLTDDQYFVWYLKEVYNLTYSDIAVLREHFGSSSNESTIRDVYMKARIKMKKLFDFCSKQQELVKKVERDE
ncbi:MAG: hypothetical protein ACTSP3_09650 [Candidatus Heimdallarchaeaceae archaeon]